MAGSNQNGRLSEFRLEQIFRPLIIIIPIAIGGNIIYVLASSKLRILKNLIDFNAGYLVLAVVLALVPWFMHTIRLLLWSKVFHGGLKPIQALQTAIVNDLGNAVTPTSTGGGYFKLVFLLRNGFAPGEATLLMFLGSLEDAIFFAFSLPMALILSRAWNDPYVTAAFKNLISHWPAAVAIITVIAVAYFVIFKRKSKTSRLENERPGLILRIRSGIHKYIGQFFTAARFVFKCGKTTLGICTVLAGIGWCCRYGAVAALVVGLGFETDPVLFFLLQWVVFSTMLLIPTPGAVGGAEVTFGLVFSGVVPGAILPILIGAWRFVTFYMPVVIGSIFMTATGAGPSTSRIDGKDQEILEEIKA